MKKLALFVLSFSFLAQAAVTSLDDTKTLSHLLEDLGEQYSEGNGSFRVYENPSRLSTQHLRQCTSSSVSAASTWLRKQFGEAFPARDVKKAVAEFGELLGDGAIERCFSKEKDQDGQLRNWTSYYNKQTHHRLLFVVL